MRKVALRLDGRTYEVTSGTRSEIAPVLAELANARLESEAHTDRLEGNGCPAATDGTASRFYEITPRGRRLVGVLCRTPAAAYDFGVMTERMLRKLAAKPGAEVQEISRLVA